MTPPLPDDVTLVQVPSGTNRGDTFHISQGTRWLGYIEAPTTRNGNWRFTGLARSQTRAAWALIHAAEHKRDTEEVSRG